MGDDSLPPGVTRGPYRGRRQSNAPWLSWVGPAVAALVWARLAVGRWVDHRDGWTFVFVAFFVVSLAAAVKGLGERRLRERPVEPE